MSANLQGWLWIVVSVLCEVAGNWLLKRFSVDGSWRGWAVTLLSYNLMLVAWMLAIRQLRNITVPGMVWLLCGQVALVLLGVGVFRESLTIAQAVGVAFSVAAVVLLCF